MCAKHSGEVVFTRKSACPHGDSKLSVGSESQVRKLTTEVHSLTSEVAALKGLTTGLSRAKVDGHETLVISKENVQIVNGTGSETTTNGLGNLILGYNDNGQSEQRNGSHNLVLGDDNGYNSYGGIVGGTLNDIYGPYASVIGGTGNGASGAEAVVVSGRFNGASSRLAAILGGYQGTVSSNDCSSIPANTDTNPSKC